MGYFDNIDEELEKQKVVKHSMLEFKKKKIKHLKIAILTKKARQEKRKLKKDERIFRKKFSKKRNRKTNKIKFYKRCPIKYERYIQSNWWEERKNKFYKQYGRKCAKCFSVKFVELHHIVYGSFGMEKDEDLIPLCKECHKNFHTLFGVKGFMRDETSEFLNM